MFFFLFSLLLGSFSVYFYALGLGFFSLVPFLFLFGMIFFYGDTTPLFQKISQALLKYSLYVAWFVVLVGLLGVLKYFGFSLMFVFLLLFVLHFLLWFVSGFFSYKEGFSLMQFGYIALFVLFFVFFASSFGWSASFLAFRMLFVMTFAFVGFALFFGPLFFSIPTSLSSVFFLLSLGMVSFLLFSLSRDIYLSLVFESIFLAAVLGGFIRLSSFRSLGHQKEVSVSVRRILAGERIHTQSRIHRGRMTSSAAFVDGFPLWTKYILEGFVLLPLLLLVSVYFSSSFAVFTNLHQFLYWVIVALFFGNVLLLKQFGHKSLFQHFFLFFVVYFAFYVSLFSYFEGSVGSSVLWSMIWNIVLSLSFFSFPQKFPHLFERRDYISWISIAFSAMLINVVLLFQTKLAGELVFFLALLYLGLQGFLLFSVAKKLLGKSSLPIE